MASNFRNKGFKRFGFGEDLTFEEPQFSMTAMYYGVITDVMRASFIASLNRDLRRMWHAVADLYDITYPAIWDSPDSEIVLEDIRQAKIRLDNPGRGGHGVQHESELWTELSRIRRKVMYMIKSILIQQSKKLSPEGKIREAMGVLNVQSSRKVEAAGRGQPPTDGEPDLDST